MERDVWIALVCVSALPGNEQLGNGQGAYVYVLAPAGNDTEFLVLARQALAEKCLKINSLEQVELFSLHQVKYVVSNGLQYLAEQARDLGKLQMGRFCFFGEELS